MQQPRAGEQRRSRFLTPTKLRSRKELNADADMGRRRWLSSGREPSPVPSSPSINESEPDAASEEASDYFEDVDGGDASNQAQARPTGPDAEDDRQKKLQKTVGSDEDTPPSASRAVMDDGGGDSAEEGTDGSAEVGADQGAHDGPVEQPPRSPSSSDPVETEKEAEPPRRPFSLASAPATPSRGSVQHPLNGQVGSQGTAHAMADRSRQGSADLGDVARMLEQNEGYRNGDESPERSASIATSVWRASMHSRVTTGDLSNVLLNGEDEDTDDRPSSSTAPPPSGGEVDALDTLSGSLSHRASIASGDTSHDIESPDLILQRLEAQNAILAQDPKSASLDGSSSRDESVSRGIQKTWRGIQGKDRLRRSIQQLQDARRLDAASADVGAINWEFWGAVMNDYEHVARTQPRELSRAIQAGIPAALRGMMWQYARCHA